MEDLNPQQNEDQTQPEPATVRPANRRARKVYAGMWGLPEMIVVAFGLAALLGTILLYVLFVLPAQKRLSDGRATKLDLEKKMTDAKARYGTITSTEERVAELRTSVDDFEARSLPLEANGKASFYQQVNGLIVAYGLTNSTGPDYAPLEAVDPMRPQNQEADAQGRGKLASIYPGMFVTMTLDGSYQNIRRFIREIETSNQFVVISTVEIEPAENQEKEVDPTKPPPQTASAQRPESVPPGMNPDFFPTQPQPQPAADGAVVDRGKMRGERVTLRLEMAVYFRR